VAGDVRVSAGAAYDFGLHVVWCPKYRRPVLEGRVAARLRELTGEKAAANGWRVMACVVMPGQVHLFAATGPADSPAHVANQFKGYTSRVLREEFPHLRSRLPALWSRWCFAAAVGAVSAAAVQRYTGTRYERPWRKEKTG
jgi:putative transposase